MIIQQAKSEYRNEQLRLRAKTYSQYMFSLVSSFINPGAEINKIRVAKPVLELTVEIWA